MTEAREPADEAADEAARVRRFWAELGLPGLVDVHTHFMPERVLRKVWAYFDSLAPGTGTGTAGPAWPIAYRGEEAERLAVLRDFGVRAFTAMLYPHKPGMAEWLNGWAAEFARRTPDCLHTATLFPEEGVESAVRTAVEAGARVFKAHVQVGDYDPADELLDTTWGLLAEAGVPVVIHCGSGPLPGRHTGPEPVRRVLARHPGLRLIVAHLGMPEFEDFLQLADRYAEVRLDTTMVFTDFGEQLAPFPRRALPRLADLGHPPGAPRQRLPQHPLRVPPPTAGPGTAGPRRRLAARRLPRQRCTPLRPLRAVRGEPVAPVSGTGAPPRGPCRGRSASG
ncbi:hypothetical protein GCM10022245_18100 [Streptomyces mayteni]